MGNLGWYQKIVTLSKAVGGPKNLILLAMGVGYITGRIGETGVKKAYKKIKSEINLKNKASGDLQTVFEVVSYGKDNKGIEFNVGDKFKILESDGDSILIEKAGNANNPYFVSHDFLKSISKFNQEKEFL